MQLRKYQEEALSAVVENLQAGVRQQLLVLATGLGKSCIAANLPAALKELLPGKLLFIAHTDELCAQAMEKMHTWNPSLKVGLEKAESHADPDCDIIVSCNASIGRSGSTRMDKFWDDITVIVADECHRILGSSWMNILEDSGVLKPESNKLLIGLTATPRRHNKNRTSNTVSTLDDENLISLKSVFQKIVFSFPIRKGIKEGFLAPLRGYRVSTMTSLDDVKVVAGEFAVDQLSAAVNTPERNARIVRAWKENAAGRQTLVFTCDIQHAKDLSEVFLHNGVMAQPIFGADPQRAEKLAWFEAGQVQVLCNCALLTEGFDSPSVSCIALAKPTRSGSAYTQMVGRGTRLHPGKDDCVVLDFCDIYKKCSLVTLPSLLGLSPQLDLHGTNVVEAAETVEAVEDKYPGINLEGLTDITKVKAFVESVDLFANPYAEDVKELSTMAWMSTTEGYTLAIPERKDLADAKQYSRFVHEKLHIETNELDEFELSITTKETQRKLGTYVTLKEAFDSAEDVLRRCRTDRVKLLLRDAPWHHYPASEPAKRMLRSRTKKRPLFWCVCEGVKSPGGICPTCKKQTGLTAGQASLALNILRTK